jgi:serine/threonine protein phosphatase PrpC
MTYVAVSGLSHVGLLRGGNEDSLAVGPWTLCSTQTESPQTLVFPLGTPLLVAIADGLGGHPGGELASGLVVRRLARAGPGLDGEQQIRDALEDCNRMLYDAVAGNPELTTMGSTVAGVVLTPDRAVAFNVGDSRVYQSGPDGLDQVSVDDRPSAGEGLPGHVVTQTLGGHEKYTAIDAHLTSSPLPPEACYLVCSDGLTDVVPTEVIARTLAEHQDGRAAFELWKAAIEAGGPDNITLAVVRVAEA